MLSDYRIAPIWYPAGRHELLEPLLAAVLPDPAGLPRGAAARAAPRGHPHRGIGRVPWRIDAATARRQNSTASGPCSSSAPNSSARPRTFSACSPPDSARATPGLIIDLRNAEGRSIEGFYQWLAVKSVDRLGGRADEALSAWEATFDEFAPAQRFTEFLETTLIPRVTGLWPWVSRTRASCRANPRSTPSSSACCAASRSTPASGPPQWQRVIVAVTRAAR